MFSPLNDAYKDGPMKGAFTVEMLGSILQVVGDRNKDSILKITNDMEQIQKEMEALSSQKDDSKYRNLMKNIRF